MTEELVLGTVCVLLGLGMYRLTSKNPLMFLPERLLDALLVSWIICLGFCGYIYLVVPWLNKYSSDFSNALIFRVTWGPRWIFIWMSGIFYAYIRRIVILRGGVVGTSFISRVLYPSIARFILRGDDYLEQKFPRGYSWVAYLADAIVRPFRNTSEHNRMMMRWFIVTLLLAGVLVLAWPRKKSEKDLLTEKLERLHDKHENAEAKKAKADSAEVVAKKAEFDYQVEQIRVRAGGITPAQRNGLYKSIFGTDKPKIDTTGL